MSQQDNLKNVEKLIRLIIKINSQKTTKNKKTQRKRMRKLQKMYNKRMIKSKTNRIVIESKMEL